MRNVPEALRQARLPDLVQKTTLEKLASHALRAVITGKEYRTRDGLSSYLVLGKDANKVADRCAVFGKELVLSGERVQYFLVGELRAMSVYAELHGQSEELSELVSGKSCIVVVPDFFTEDWWTTNAERSLVYTTIQRLYYANHGLVLGGASSVRDSWVIPGFATFLTNMGTLSV